MSFHLLSVELKYLNLFKSYDSSKLSKENPPKYA